MCRSILVLKFFVYPGSTVVHTAKTEIRECVKWSLTKEVKNNRKSITVRPKKWSRAVAHRRWSFTRASNCKALTGKVLVFWIGGHLLEVVAHGG